MLVYMSLETPTTDAENLPRLREDIHFDEVGPEFAHCLMEEGIAVLKCFDELDAATVLRDLQIISTAHAPLRAVRKALDIAAPNPTALPSFLRRKPLQISLDHTDLFSAVSHQVIETVEGINEDLYELPEVAAVYGNAPHQLTNALINRSSKNGWFASHQDSLGVRGIGYSVQTVQTMWHVRPSLTIPGAEDFTFMTFPGDVVAIRERADDLDSPDPLLLGQGFTEYYPEGSVVHSGLDLSGETRYSLNLFCTEYFEV